MNKRNQYDLLGSELGASLVEAMVLMPLFMLLLFTALDLGQALYVATEVAGAARAGALYGSQHPNDTADMKTVAQDDASDVPGLSVGTPTYACECADGTLSSASCTTTPSCAGGLNWVYVAKVTVTGTYKPLLPWPGVPKSMSISSSAAMRSAGS